jgi:zinc protease
VSGRELQKAKNLLISSEISYRETNDGKANAIEQALAYRGSVAAVNDSVVRIQNVTAADVMRVMNRYFNDSGRVVIHYNQAPTGGDR